MPKTVHGSQFTVHNTQKKKATILPGFSLLEILLSILMMMTLLVMVFSTSGTYIQSRSTSLQSIATNITSKQMETLRNTDFASLPSCSTPCPFPDPDLAKLPSATATETLTDYPSSSGKVKLVTILVSWQDNAKNKNLKLETLIYQYGL